MIALLITAALGLADRLGLLLHDLAQALLALKVQRHQGRHCRTFSYFSRASGPMQSGGRQRAVGVNRARVARIRSPPRRELPPGARWRSTGHVRHSRLKLRSTQQRRCVRLRPRCAVCAWTLMWPPSAVRRCREGTRPSACATSTCTCTSRARRLVRPGRRSSNVWVRGNPAHPQILRVPE